MSSGKSIPSFYSPCHSESQENGFDVGFLDQDRVLCLGTVCHVHILGCYLTMGGGICVAQYSWYITPEASEIFDILISWRRFRNLLWASRDLK